MPNVLAAIDGKHICLRGTLFHNYKGLFSIVLLAICDVNYYFTMFDLGQYGSYNDSSVLGNSKMGQIFENNELNLPAPRSIPGCDVDL